MESDQRKIDTLFARISQGERLRLLAWCKSSILERVEQVQSVKRKGGGDSGPGWDREKRTVSAVAGANH